jgi:2-desacetyl-2-hydroxyethyl bacteriochlorophyllide A dehydrogenase
VAPSVVVFDAPHSIRIDDETTGALAPGQVRVRTLYSGVSAGTELTAYRGTNPYLHRRWDPERRLFMEGQEGTGYPAVHGYEESGVVLEAAPDVAGLKPGMHVCGSWGHRGEAVVQGARLHVLPDGVDPVLGVFCRIGAIALNGILDARINLGETVAVFGLGVVGQLVCQLARLSGAQVIAVDPVESRRRVALELGATEVLGDGAAEAIKARTGGRGADVCIESSGATAALHQAVRACAYSSRVVALGFFQGDAVGLRLGDEFHHNRIDLVCSQISGVDPVLQHRWDDGRLAREFLRLVGEGRVTLHPLITDVVPVAQAPELFRRLDQRLPDVLQTVLAFEHE